MVRDEAWLLDILISGRDAVEFLDSLSWEEFVENRMVQHAVTKSPEILGEAAGRVSRDSREAHPDIPWSLMIGMRNRLVHEYFRIDLQAVWDTVSNDVPGLTRKIEPLVPPEEEA
jgi:uncharacterized protein with HEPN domain